MVSENEKRVAERWGMLLLIANVAGAVEYVFAASDGWRDPQIPVTGEPFIWAISVLPICGVFLLLNVTWGIFALTRRNRMRAVWWLMTVPVWLAAIAIDFAHH
jgi:hypothetical protein